MLTGSTICPIKVMASPFGTFSHLDTDFTDSIFYFSPTQFPNRNSIKTQAVVLSIYQVFVLEKYL